MWPKGTIGSLSHSYERVIACAGWQSDMTGAGIDVERVVDQSELFALEQVVITEREQAVLARSKLSRHQAATLIFSAKESFYKCFSSHIKANMNFYDVSLIEFQNGMFTLNINTTLSHYFHEGEILHGRYFLENDYIVTLIAFQERNTRC